MKLVLASDIHGNIKHAEKIAEIANKNNAAVIIAGDFMIGTVDNPEERFSEILKILSGCKKNVYVIPGNYETFTSYMQVIDEKYKNIIDINKRIVDLKDFYLAGYGGGNEIYGYVVGKTYFKINPELDKLIIEKMIKKSDKPVVFVSHIPPYSYLDTAIFRIDEKGAFHSAKVGEPGAQIKVAGNKILKTLIEKHKPMLCVFGHIHESAGGYMELFNHKKKEESKNMLVNPGPEKVFLVGINDNKVKILNAISVD